MGHGWWFSSWFPSKRLSTFKPLGYACQNPSNSFGNTTKATCGPGLCFHLSFLHVPEDVDAPGNLQIRHSHPNPGKYNTAELVWLWVKSLYPWRTFGKWIVHPPQNGIAIGCDPWPFGWQVPLFSTRGVPWRLCALSAAGSAGCCRRRRFARDAARRGPALGERRALSAGPPEVGPPRGAAQLRRGPSPQSPLRDLEI